MFLAIKEIRYSKLRYGLIIGIMFLIAYVVFMLSGLANGLSEEFKKQSMIGMHKRLFYQRTPIKYLQLHN